ncbi:hypothetical protein GGD83_004709 [Rhodoblastus sphagnicola]|nr:hypothetical protein [Rhodoblastus sphagnicola]
MMVVFVVDVAVFVIQHGMVMFVFVTLGKMQPKPQRKVPSRNRSRVRNQIRRLIHAVVQFRA